MKKNNTNEKKAREVGRASSCSAQLGNVFWVTTDEPTDEINAAQDRCYGCAEKAVKKLKSKNPEADALVDGGWDGGHEVESPAYCCDCGEPLSCYLMSTNINTSEWDEDERYMSDTSTHRNSSAKFAI